MVERHIGSREDPYKKLSSTHILSDTLPLHRITGTLRVMEQLTKPPVIIQTSQKDGPEEPTSAGSVAAECYHQPSVVPLCHPLEADFRPQLTILILGRWLLHLQASQIRLVVLKPKARVHSCQDVFSQKPQ